MLRWQVFIVRIWQEPSSGAWRGQITHLPDQARDYFADWTQAGRFIGRFIPAFDPTWQTPDPLDESLEDPPGLGV